MVNEYESYVFIADYHALNFIQDKKEMTENIVDLMIDYMAIGLDPEKVVLFKPIKYRKQTKEEAEAEAGAGERQKTNGGRKTKNYRPKKRKTKSIKNRTRKNR
jgi:tryptophanyl-tRNA synthetase